MVESRIMRISALTLCLALLAPAAPSVSAQTFSVPVVYKKLPNGLRVVISENHAAPVVVVELMYRIGFRIEPKGRTGFAHLFEHLMFQGSEHVAKFEHVRIVNENRVDPFRIDRKSTRLNSSHQIISYAVFCLKKKKRLHTPTLQH